MGCWQTVGGVFAGPRLGDRRHSHISPQQDCLMRTLSSFSFLLSCAVLGAQDGIAYYKFDSPDAAEVVNHATGSAAAPRFAASTFAANTTYTSGMFGHAMQESGYFGLIGTWLHTGWPGGLQGSMTIAFALENRTANSSQPYSPIAGQPSWSIATGGSAGSGLKLTGVGTGDLTGSFGAPLCTMVGWQHFAIVVDAPSSTATWYHNGSLVSSTTISGPVFLPIQSELRVGTDYVTHCGGFYAIDEFRMLDRAASAAEISNWATTTTASAVVFGESPTHAVVLDPVATPVIGSAAFGVRVADAQATLFALMAGFSYSRFGAMALPLDLSTLTSAAVGIDLLVAPQVTILGLVQGGEATVGLPIPNIADLAGTVLCMQGLTLDSQEQLRGSNGVIASLGH